MKGMAKDFKKTRSTKRATPYSVVEPHRCDADPDSTYYPDADQDSDFILFGSGCGSGSNFLS